jgi:hypothetical protein
VSGPFLGLVIESLVAVLLVLTIFYCMILNRRLARLRSDESSLRGTIAELVTATEIAERAIAGLKTTVRACDHTLGERLRTAERFGADLGRELKRGDEILARIIQITAAASGTAANGTAAKGAAANDAGAQAEPAKSDAIQPPRAENGSRGVIQTAATAQAIASRARLRAGKAA